MWGFIKRFLAEDRPMSTNHMDDYALVSFAANILEVSEYALFEAAYCRHYGRSEAPDMEPEYGKFLMTGQDLPVYVREFAREVVNKFANKESLHEYQILLKGHFHA